MKTENPKLYQSSASPNSRRVRIYLAERGICVAQVPVDLGAKEQFSSAFAAINPRRVVPAMVLGDGTTIRWRRRRKPNDAVSRGNLPPSFNTCERSASLLATLPA